MASEVNQIFNANEPKSIVAVDKVLVQVDDTVLKLNTDIDTLSKSLANNNITFAQLAEAHKKVEGTSKVLTDAEKKLIASEKAIAEALKLKIAEEKKATAATLKASEAAKKLTVSYQKQIVERAKIIQNSKLLAKAQAAEKGSTAQLSVVVVILEKRLSGLNQKTAEGAKKAALLTSAIDKTNKKITAQSSAMNKQRRNIGNYGSAFSGLGSKVKGLATQFAGALGLTSVIFLFVNVLKGAFNTIREFTKQSAVLAGVLGVTRKETKQLTDQSISLGATYPVTASEVNKLQVSYARLGFTMAEISDLTEATIVGSIALNAGLDETATLVGAVVKAYSSLGTSDAGEIIDTLTLATQKSSLSFGSLENALPKVAGAADALGFSLAKTSAHLGTAIDATLDGSTAGTSLRKIYISLANKGITLDDALNKIKGSTNKLKTSFDLFGARAAIVGLALANNSDKTKNLEIELGKAGGTAERVAKIQMATLDGSMKGTGSAWEKLILQFRSSEGFLSSFFDGLTVLFNFMSGSLTTSTEKFNEQLIAVQGLQSGLVPLVDEYETLTGKTELSVEEQDRLKIVIGEIADITPGAITEINEYGDVISISADKAIQFVEAQKEMLKLKNVDAIKDQEKALKKLDVAVAGLNIKLSRGVMDDFGQWQKLNPKEIAAVNLDLQNLGKERQRLDNLLLGLKGDFMPTVDDTRVENLSKAITTASRDEIDTILKKNKILIDSNERYTAIIEKNVADRLVAILNAENLAGLAQLTSEQEKTDKRLKIQQDYVDKLEILYTDLDNKLLVSSSDFFDKLAKNFEDKFDKLIERTKGIFEETRDILSNLDFEDEEEADTSVILERIEEERLVRIKSEDDVKEAKKQAAAAAVEIINLGFNFRRNKLNQELQAAEGNAEKEKEIRTKLAKQEKTQALFNIEISTAQGILKAIEMFGPPPSPAGIFGIAAAVGLGAAQAGVVIATKIPEFAEGAANTPDKYIAGERGRELMELNSGKLLMVDEPTYFEGNEFKGATIHKNKDTERIISQTKYEGFKGNSMTDTRIVNELQQTRKAIENMPQTIISDTGNLIAKRTRLKKENYYYNKYGIN